MGKILLTTITLLFSFSVNSQTATTDSASDENTEPHHLFDGFKLVASWKCYERSDYSKQRVLVTLTRRVYFEGNFERGLVRVADTEYVADIRMHGFDRRWDFGGNQYAFIMSPDGSGKYYDFTVKSKGVQPSQVYQCVEDETAESSQLG
jgi:hypothetical protein